MILITGANGLVGNFVCRKLLEESIPFKAMVRKNSDLSWLSDIKDKINWVEGDITDILSIEEAIQGCDTVIHSAAIVSYDPRDRKIMRKVNIEGTANLVDVSIKAGVRKLIHVSSVAAVGKPKGMKVVDENTTWVDSNVPSVYAESKHESEIEAWRGNMEGLDVCIINPSLILGPGDWNRSSGRIFKYVYEQKPFYTDKKANYVDVRDVANIIVKLYKENITGERFIVNAGQIEYKELFEKIAREFNKRPPFIKVNYFVMYIAMIMEKIKSWITGKEPYVTRETITLSEMNVFYDNSKIVKELNYKFIPVDETIKWTCEELEKKIL